MPHVVALIPARSGSSLKHKNIRTLAGHPLIAYSIRAALKANCFDRVIVSTDSPAYAEIAKNYGAEVPFIQPADTAKDDSGDYPCIAHFLEWIDKNLQTPPDFIVHLRPTTPFRNPDTVSAAIKYMDDEVDRYVTDNFTALRSVHEMPESAYKCFEIMGGLLTTLHGSLDVERANRPRQYYQTTYQANGYVDVLRPDFIRKYGKLHGSRVAAFATSRVIEVDTEEDFKMLEYQAYNDPELVRRLL